jgi:uncharacterized protein
MYQRNQCALLFKRLKEPRRFIQILAGPRQTGKTTIARQVLADLDLPSHYATGDEPTLKGKAWLEQQWETGRFLTGPEKQNVVLVLDEVHKISGWSETVKRLWDEDTSVGTLLRVVLLGSSPLLMWQGLTESMAGRFEIIPVSHWSYEEMRAAFGWSMEQFVFYGGYPGGASLLDDHQRWRSYVQESLIETSISRDLLMTTRIDKPALLRRLFELGCNFSGQVLSYQKMLGQLQDAGNTTTLAHYLRLLQGTGLLAGLVKYSPARVRQRAASPKLLVLNTALLSALSHLTLDEARQDRAAWGRWVESAVGASLYNSVMGKGIELTYWASRNREVDFVLSRGKDVVAIEVKSGRVRDNLPGIEAFSKEFSATRKLLVGSDGIPLDRFLSTPPEQWLG